VLGVSVALLGLAVAGAMLVPVGLNEQVSMEVNSDLYNYFTYEKKYIEVGPPVYLVFNNFDYQNEHQV
jgi:Niemann-Pick C1 protein